MIRRLQGLAASLLLLAILGGVPAVLVGLATRPGFLPTWQRLTSALTAPDDGRFLLVVIWVAAWIVWAMMGWLILREIAAIIRGIQAPHLPAVAIPQGMAKRLVAAAALLFIAVPNAPQTAHADPGPAVTDSATPVATATHTPPPSTAERAEEVQVMVGPSDTLWGYAQDYLGDGSRWPEIYLANQGVPQVVGGTLSDPDLIVDGWHLSIPTTAPTRTPPATTAEPQVQVTVGPGDTLWGYAQTYLGDGNRWPEIYDANQGVPQTGGGSLSDPDLILDDWHLTIPTTARTPTPTRDDTQPATPTPTPSTRVPPGGDDTPPAPTSAPPTSSHSQETTTAPPALVLPPIAPVPPVAPTSASTSVPTTGDPFLEEHTQEVGKFQSSPVWQVAGLAGAGLFLGAGVFATLRRRRRDQFRQRQPGLMITTPDPIVAPIEMSATLAADLSPCLLAHIDHVLRATAAHLADLPEISAVGVSPEGTITLHTTTQLEDPWQPVTAGWSLPADTTPEQTGAFNPDAPAPYPLLVSIGVDDTGTTWLLNLEYHGILTVGGDEAMRDDFLRYLAAELAVNPWSGDVRVACLGIATETVPMASDSFDLTDERVTALAAGNVERTARSHTTAATGRLHQLQDEAWPAVVMITTDTTTGQELQHLIEIHPRHNGAALLRSAATGDLNLSAGGRLNGFGFDLIPVGLTTDEAAGCAALLSAANDTSPGQPVEAADTITDKTGNLLTHTSVERDDTHTPATDPVLPAPDNEYIDVAPVTSVDLQLLAPKVRAGIAEEILARDPYLDCDVAAWFSPRCPRPRLTWLGPVTARCHGTPPTKSKAYYVEVLSFLAAHPNGVTTDQLVDAFAITPGRTRTVISNLRQWVGTNPTTGQPHIPEAKKSPQADARGVGLYLVEDLLIDADLFRRLRTRAHAKGSNGIQDLEMALTLVTGRSFDQLRPTGWTWLANGDRIDHHMTCAISDVAHTLVSHHLHAGNLPAARKAAETGLTVCPESETAALDLAGIMVHEGNGYSGHQLLTDAFAGNSDGDPADPSERTSQILQSKNYLRTA